MVLVLALFSGASLGLDDNFEGCRRRAQRIIQGKETYGSINNITIWDPERPLIYTGFVRGLDPHYSREDVLTLTYDGGHTSVHAQQ